MRMEDLIWINYFKGLREESQKLRIFVLRNGSSGEYQTV